METKFCPGCKTEKPVTEFNKNSRKKDGCQSRCRECQKKIDRASYAKSEKRRNGIKERRKEVTAYNVKMIRRIKLKCGCSLCEEKEPICLDFHHVNAEDKLGNPSYFRSCATETLRTEIRKCVLLCANCHRKVHAGLLTL